MSHTRTPAPEESYLLPYMTAKNVEKIFQANPTKKWLIRESSFIGMITLDLVNASYSGKSTETPFASHRLAGLPYQGWLTVNNATDAQRLKNIFFPITAKTFNLHRSDFEKHITIEFLNPQKYDLSDRISPAMYSAFIENNKTDKPVVDESSMATQPLEDEGTAFPAKRASTEQSQIMTRSKTIIGIRSNSGNGPRPAFFQTQPLVSAQTSSSEANPDLTGLRPKRNGSNGK